MDGKSGRETVAGYGTAERKDSEDSRRSPCNRRKYRKERTGGTDTACQFHDSTEIRKFIAERIENLEKGLAGFEKIKRFTLLPREFSIESGELTNTLKIRRPVINSRYADEIEAMYC